MKNITGTQWHTLADHGAWPCMQVKEQTVEQTIEILPAGRAHIAATSKHSGMRSGTAAGRQMTSDSWSESAPLPQAVRIACAMQ